MIPQQHYRTYIPEHANSGTHNTYQLYIHSLRLNQPSSSSLVSPPPIYHLTHDTEIPSSTSPASFVPIGILNRYFLIQHLKHPTPYAIMSHCFASTHARHVKALSHQRRNVDDSRVVIDICQTPGPVQLCFR